MNITRAIDTDISTNVDPTEDIYPEISNAFLHFYPGSFDVAGFLSSYVAMRRYVHVYTGKIEGNVITYDRIKKSLEKYFDM